MSFYIYLIKFKRFENLKIETNCFNYHHWQFLLLFFLAIAQKCHWCNPQPTAIYVLVTAISIGASVMSSLCIYKKKEKKGTRCSSVVRVFAHGAMGRWIDP